MLVRAGETNLLIDAGLSARALAAALAKKGVGASDFAWHFADA